MVSGSYEHCSGCLVNNTCPQSTEGCSVTLTGDTWRSLIDKCDGNTGCSVQADRTWSSITCVTRGRTDYMKIVYECVDPVSSSSAAVTRQVNTAYWSDDNDEIGSISQHTVRPTSSHSHLLLIGIIASGTHALSLHA